MPKSYFDERHSILTAITSTHNQSVLDYKLTSLMTSRLFLIVARTLLVLAWIGLFGADSSYMAQVASQEEPEPWFAEKIPNNTVAAGRDVTLPCVVEGLGKFKVAWIHTNRHTLLTLHDRVISRNPRYKIAHNNLRTWWLTISDVKQSDSGHYMCQINTSPMKSIVGTLQVVVPPTILENETSSDTDVREGVDVSLKCRANGYPKPEIKWRREDEKDITLGPKKAVPTVQGEFLNLTKTSRLHMAAYLCIASNGVQPSVSKRIMLNVNFAPMIWIPNQLVGAAVGSDVELDCNLESHPKSVTYWTKEGGVMILSNIKYDSLIQDTALYKVQMRLHIRDLLPQDFGSYTCVAKNSLGETEGTIRLYEIPKPQSSTTSSKGAVARSRSEGAAQASGEKMILRKWHQDGTDVRSADMASDLEKRDSATPVTVYYIPEQDNSENAESVEDTGSRERRLSITMILLLIFICLRFSTLW